MPQVPPPKRHPYDQWSPDARALDLIGDKWTLLIIRDLMPGPRRFVELQRVLPGISTEQLRSRLNRMVADGILTRKRYREVPPRVDYELTERARALTPILTELAHWGYRWAWSEPHEGERVDPAAIFRLAAGLISPDTLAGAVELTVIGDDGVDETYTVTAAGGASAVVESPAESASVKISGNRAAWVKALSPSPDPGALQITGDEALGRRVVVQLGDGGPGPRQVSPHSQAA